MPKESVTSNLKEQILAAQQKYPTQLNKDDYLTFALECAELSMKSLKLAENAEEKNQIRTGCNKLLNEADRAKKTQDFEPVCAERLISIAFPNDLPSAVKRLEAPVSTRKLPKSELILLWRGSKLNGHAFPPWDEDPKPEEFALGSGGELFTDPAVIPLSHEQEHMLDDWKRPPEAVPPPNWPLAFPGTQVEFDRGPSMALKPNVKVDLVQDAAPDCSVVASFSAGISRGEKGHARILASVIYPYDHPIGVPKMSPNGKYVLRLSFNGCARKVVIDDRLPVSKTKRLLHVTDRNFPNLLWPALLEKAYLKVRGGYDFPGSNSGTDIWIMLGWIPEQVFLQHEDTDEEHLWTRLKNSYEYGDVLVTLGTSHITPEVESESGLAGDHDYAVLDVKEVDGRRLLLVKNPWLKATAWKDPTDDSEQCNNSENLAPGTYWMSMHAVTQNFLTMYLNWNPGLFKHRQDFHFSWDLTSPSRSPPGSIINNPQYTLVSATGDTVWLLLSRHFQDRPPDAPPLADSPHSTARADEAFISLYAFEGRDRRVYLSKGVTTNSLYVDAPQTLLRLDLPPNVPYTIAASEQHLPPTQHTFSLFAFSRSPLSIAPAAPQHSSRVTVSGAWTAQTAGGTPSTPTYGLNPQYALHLPAPSHVTLVLENPGSTLSVHVALAHAHGTRLHALPARALAASSGPDYRRGCALAATAAPLPPGAYTVVASAFDPGRCGAFVLHADADCAVELRPLPRDGAGLLRAALPEAVFAPGARKLVAALRVRRLARVRFAARPVALPGLGVAASPSPLRVTVERVPVGAEPGAEVEVAASSSSVAGAGVGGGGEFSDAATGVRVADVDVRPEENGRCWLVLERLGGGAVVHGGGSGERVAVEAFADGIEGVEVGEWKEVE